MPVILEQVCHQQPLALFQQLSLRLFASVSPIFQNNPPGCAGATVKRCTPGAYLDAYPTADTRGQRKYGDCNERIFCGSHIICNWFTSMIADHLLSWMIIQRLDTNMHGLKIWGNEK